MLDGHGQGDCIAYPFDANRPPERARHEARAEDSGLDALRGAADIEMISS